MNTIAKVAAEHAEDDRTLAQIMTDYDTLHAIFDSAREVLCFACQGQDVNSNRRRIGPRGLRS